MVINRDGPQGHPQKGSVLIVSSSSCFERKVLTLGLWDKPSTQYIKTGSGEVGQRFPHSHIHSQSWKLIHDGQEQR